MSVSVTLNYSSSPEATIKAMVDATKDGLVAAVEHWHEHMMPNHFTVAGGRKYNYQPRKGDNEGPRLMVTAKRPDGSPYQRSLANWHYSWKKRRKLKHNKPLVWSGASEAAARSFVRLSSVKRKTGLIVGQAAMPNLPKYFYQYRKDLKTPDKADELTRTTPDEVQILAEIVDRVAQVKLANAPQRRQKVKVA